MNIRKRFDVVSSPNYYFGISISRLLLHNLTGVFGFFQRRGPSRRLLKRLRSTKNSAKGRSALVLGTGPSLAKLDLNAVELSNYDVFVVNKFFQSPAAEKIIPKYYCLSDPNFFVDDKTNATFDDNSFLDYLYKTKPTLLVSHFYRNSKKYKDLKCIYFNDKEFRWMRQSISPIRPRSYVSLTLYKALAIATYMNYDAIYVLGMDNNEFSFYRSDINNKIYVDFAKYYAPGTHVSIENGNQQLPEGYTSGMAGRLQFFGEIFGDLHKFSKYPIFNLDKDSLVDAFPKLESHTLILKC